MQPLYDEIGDTYGATRHADPRITQALTEYVGPEHTASLVNLACGNENYTCALEVLGGHWHGIDNSHAMLEQARSKNQRKVWRRAEASALPYPDGTFAGAICALAIHPFLHLDPPFSEVFRVLNAGRFVLFTAFPEQMGHYWLCHYFPQMMTRSMEKMPSEATIVGALRRAGFVVRDVSPFHITNDLQDLFLYSGKDRPEIYLNPAVRANISSFANHCPPAELEHGLHALHSDIEHDRFRDVASRFSSPTGDYAFVIAERIRQ